MLRHQQSASGCYRARGSICAVLVGAAACLAEPANGQPLVDAVGYFARQAAAGGAGTARKTRTIDARSARLGEIVVTIIKGEGKETQSPPAKQGDMVVRNRCAETGNEELLASAATFAKRYSGPIGRRDDQGWSPYRPRGVPMRYIVVPAAAEPFAFTAPWGERMVARPGDAIVQEPGRPSNTYRIARAAFECTYEVVRPPRAPVAGVGQKRGRSEN